MCLFVTDRYPLKSTLFILNKFDRNIPGLWLGQRLGLDAHCSKVYLFWCLFFFLSKMLLEAQSGKKRRRRNWERSISVTQWKHKKHCNLKWYRLEEMEGGRTDFERASESGGRFTGVVVHRLLAWDVKISLEYSSFSILLHWCRTQISLTQVKRWIESWE